MQLPRAPLDLGHENKLGHQELKRPASSKSSCFQSPPTRDWAQPPGRAATRFPVCACACASTGSVQSWPQGGKREYCGRAHAQQALPPCEAGSIGRAPLLPSSVVYACRPRPEWLSVSGDPHLRKTYLCERSVPLRDWPRSVGSTTSPIVRTLVQNWPPFFTKLRRRPGEESQGQVQPAFPGSLRKRNLMWPQRGSQLPPERSLPWGGRGPTVVRVLPGCRGTSYPCPRTHCHLLTGFPRRDVPKCHKKSEKRHRLCGLEVYWGCHTGPG